MITKTLCDKDMEDGEIIRDEDAISLDYSTTTAEFETQIQEVNTCIVQNSNEEVGQIVIESPILNVENDVVDLHPNINEITSIQH